MNARKFTYAVQIQPRTGQQINEFRNGCELDGARPLTEQEQRANPHASDQAWEDAVPVITEQREIYLVPADEV